MAHTLENSERHSVFQQTLGLGELHLAPPTKMHLTPDLSSAMTSTFVDLKAPGIREQHLNPSFPYFGPYKSSLYQHNAGTAVNNAPVPNFEDPMMSGPTPSWIHSDWHRRYASAWYDILQETPVKESWHFRNYSNYIVPHTGFSSFSDLVPKSTMGFL